MKKPDRIEKPDPEKKVNLRSRNMLTNISTLIIRQLFFYISIFAVLKKYCLQARTGPEPWTQEKADPLKPDLAICLILFERQC